MLFIQELIFCYTIFFLIEKCSGLSFNKPKLCPNATWNSRGITFSTRLTNGRSPRGIFIDQSNTIYIADRTNHSIQIWTNGQTNPTKMISGDFNSPYALFVAINGEIYIENGAKKRIDKWMKNSEEIVNVINVTDHCLALFVDIENNLYYIIEYNHQVLKISLNDTERQPMSVAGNSSSGSLSTELDYPHGIFVNINQDLYVADSNNHRIQLFKYQNINGLTIVGNQSLNYPTSVTLDGNDHLYIVDNQNHRIVKYDYQIFKCLIGCLNGEGANDDQLSLPRSLAFDIQGNIFVTDQFNDRIQKFLINNSICDSILTTNHVETTDRITTTATNTKKFIVSFNQPKFCADAIWDTNGITFANQSMVGKEVLAIFVNIMNTVYTADQTNGRIQIWNQGDIDQVKTISGIFNESWSLFVTDNEQIYLDNGAKKKVEKWTINPVISETVMTVNTGCAGLFVDRNNDLYCSISSDHKVLKKSLDDNLAPVPIAGTTSAGTAANRLDNPRGIFVDKDLNLYIADCYNHRIQLFRSGQSSGITININGIDELITLRYPTGVILDYDGFLFIVDNVNHRILGQNQYGFKCLIACSKISGSTADHLDYPYTMAFDTYGNIFVTDQNNHRIQKFLYKQNSCVQTSTNSNQNNLLSTDTIIKKTSPFTTATPSFMSSPATQQMTTTEYFLKSSTNEVETTFNILSISSTIDTNHRLITTEETNTRKDVSTSTEEENLKMSTSTMPSHNQTCLSPRVTLIPSALFLSNPKEYQRNEEIFLSSSIQTNCSLSHLIITKWTIHICTITCFHSLEIESLLNTELNELEIPSRTFNYGLYQIKLTVTMKSFPDLTTSSFIYIQINPSSLAVNLISLGTSLITIGEKHDLVLDPGKFSINPDEQNFNRKEWLYRYSCRIYNPITDENFFPIDNRNHSCFPNQLNDGNLWKSDEWNSSLTILAGSLISNQTYQISVHITNVKKSSLQGLGYLTVQVKDNHSPIILIGCIISALCFSKDSFKYLNPKSQLSLYSFSIDSCSSIEWNIYYSSTKHLQWKKFNQTKSLKNNYFFGINTSNLTITKTFFDENNQTLYWRFQVIYSFDQQTSLSALDFLVNHSPRNGSCEISPAYGTTNTLFTISCSNWFDEDGIKDYSVSSWTNDQSEEIFLGFTTIPMIELQLPPGDNQTSLINIRISIRDMFDCVTEFDIDSVTVVSDLTIINTLIDTLQQSKNQSIENLFDDLLLNSNKNTMAQKIISLVEQLNQMNINDLNFALTNSYPLGNISVSPLNSNHLTLLSMPWNDSIYDQYMNKLNNRGKIRDYLIKFLRDFSVNILQNIKLHSSILVQLTKSTNELTRTTTIIASSQCRKYSMALKTLASSISFEDALYASTRIIQCASNVHTGINGVLQQRIPILEIDIIDINILKDDYPFILYDIDLNLDEDEISQEIIIDYYQHKISTVINRQFNEMTSSITAVLNIHLNMEQTVRINSKEIYFSLEKILIESLQNKTIQLIDNSRFRIPSRFNLVPNNRTFVLLRSRLQRVALVNQYQFELRTDFSRSISLSILDENLDEISIRTENTNPIEMFIPRDPNLFLSPLILQNVTSIDNDERLFHLHLINLSEEIFKKDLAHSLHFEIHPIDKSLAYLFIYKFDPTPQFDSSFNQRDGWILFCSSNKSSLPNDNIYKYFLDNRVVSNHRSIIVGLRQLNSKEIEDYCLDIPIDNPPIIDSPFNFTSDYYLRVYTSACYYLDQSNYWKSDGLWVGPLTNHKETHCFSNHLTTFSAGFRYLLPKSNYQMKNQSKKNISLSNLFNAGNNKSQSDLINNDIYHKCFFYNKKTHTN